MSGMASQITSLGIVYSTVYPGADQRKHQSPASLAFVRGIHRGPVNSPHKWPVTRKLFPFDDVIMVTPLMVGCQMDCDDFGERREVMPVLIVQDLILVISAPVDALAPTRETHGVIRT